jgi:hypothetical protein
MSGLVSNPLGNSGFKPPPNQNDGKAVALAEPDPRENNNRVYIPNKEGLTDLKDVAAKLQKKPSNLMDLNDIFNSFTDLNDFQEFLGYISDTLNDSKLTDNEKLENINMIYNAVYKDKIVNQPPQTYSGRTSW